MFSFLPATENTGLFMAADSSFTEARGVLLGASLDDTCSFRPGSRFAPSFVRMVSRSLEEYSIYQKKSLKDLPFYDAGDLVLSPGSTANSLEIISKSVSSLLHAGKKPFIIGGEHTVTLASVKGCLEHYKELLVLYFDAHADMRPSYQGVTFSHASVAYHLHNLQGITLYQLGVRSVDEEELVYIQKERFHAFQVIEPLKNILPLLKNIPLYISFDIDVVDPAFAPGVTSPEPGGITSKEILDIIYLLADYSRNVVAFDLVEICPPFDPSQITILLGAKILREALLAFL
jgi:agmatinase